MKRPSWFGQDKSPLHNFFLFLLIITVLGLLHVFASNNQLNVSLKMSTSQETFKQHQININGNDAFSVAEAKTGNKFGIMGKNRNHNEARRVVTSSGSKAAKKQNLLLTTLSENKQKKANIFSSEENDTTHGNVLRSEFITKSAMSGESSTIRADKCKRCFTHNFELIIDNDKICSLYGGQSKIDVLILISSSHSKRQARDTIRQTWATAARNNTANVRYVFMFGTADDKKLDSFVSAESELYGDIIQEDFRDSYKNLTYKTIMGFKWASSRCKMAEFVFKTDDDVWLNIPALLRVIGFHKQFLQTGMLGYCKQMSEPIRDPNSKWYASWESYPGNYYPTFCSGTGYLMSMHVTRNVYKVSRNIPFFHLEDVYVAFCMNNLHYGAKNATGFHSWDISVGDLCYYKSRYVITVHELDYDMMKKIWRTDCRQSRYNV